ncbi:xylose isomerase [Longimicrobium terrae]|uniref:Xylose isomerase n=1 Tax=Longimicrobium terrae TaxID=1639882 RepID=A0A841H3T6_9BACT|nr:xylose isomerase [Longimicrobium terrae]MBB4638493.1 xylose isomerase [Longimicrobium terrae]MBB6072664.1 xylose isomerase [Longimicrobium terrae]NNC32460.1 xylose isomerase [Longimicrobium terrae]
MTLRTDEYTPKPEHHFTFGLWTVGNTGRDPFGDPVRPAISPNYIVQKLGEIGAYGVNFHDEDLVPRDASAADRDRIVREFRAALDASGVRVPMATTNLFGDPAFRDGAFTSNDPRVRRYALQKTMRSMDLGVEFGAETYVFWGGREGTETNAAKDPREAMKWFREAINYLCEYSKSQGYEYRFALEPKPNEPRGDIYLPTIGHALAFIHTLDHPEMVGVNPEVAHDTMAGLDFAHGVGQALDAGKLFHIDLNDQKAGRYDQDFRFGAVDPKSAFFLVKLLEDSGYDGMRHFDAHAYRTEDEDGVWDFARGCMRTYLILKDKAARWNADAEIQQIVGGFRTRGGETGEAVRFSAEHAAGLKEQTLDLEAIRAQGYGYERLDQLTMEILLGVR